ncbi:hypothetical protein J6590_039768 [Homalodisca vitripennis]|nr:hypothetical protein J6590_039768 [Homalodisca vitripennis]
MSAEQLLYRAIHPSPAIVRSVDSEPNLQRAYCNHFGEMEERILPMCYQEQNLHVEVTHTLTISDITGKRYLKEFAIPRRNLPARFTSPLTTKFNVKSLNRLKYRGHFALHNPDGRRLTAPRRFLGASILKDVPLRPSYTRTVWVVRKPPANSKTEADKEDGNGKDSEENYCNGDVTVTKAFSLAAQSEKQTPWMSCLKHQLVCSFTFFQFKSINPFNADVRRERTPLGFTKNADVRWGRSSEVWGSAKDITEALMAMGTSDQIISQIVQCDLL